MAQGDLNRISALLAEHHPEVREPVSRDPFALVLWEQVAYLATDDVRQDAFSALKKRVGTSPEHIKAAPLKTLQSIARIGGSIAVKERAERMKRSAVLAPTLTGLGELPLAEARKRVAKFPMIGAPGVDKLLLFARLFKVFALESNGLRVLMRIGFGKEGKDYAASYRSVMAAIDPQLPDDLDERILLHQRLRQHGLQICKRSAPRCAACSVRPYCRFGRRIHDV